MEGFLSRREILFVQSDSTEEMITWSGAEGKVGKSIAEGEANCALASPAIFWLMRFAIN